MKNIYILFISVLFTSVSLLGQDIPFQSFDDVSSIGNWINSTGGTHAVTQSSDANEGTGSLSLVYNLVGDQGWGGSVDFQMLPTTGGATFDDASAAEGISFWYKVVSPATVSATWNTKLYIESTGGQEEWHAGLGGVIEDASGEWQQAKLPFTNFAIPSWLTTLDGALYPDKIAKIEMQIVTPEGSTTEGEILIDGLAAYVAGGTSAGNLLESFDSAGDTGSSINSDAGSFDITSSMDAVEGSGSTCLEYFLVADQSWGGSVDLSFTPDNNVYADLSADDGIRFNYKIPTPASDGQGLQWNVKLFVNSNGGVEEWHAVLGGNILSDDTGEWQEGKLNFGSFAIPSWLTTYDGVLYKDSISRIDMQVISNTVGMQTAGSICLDNLTSFTEDAIKYDGYYLNDFELPTTAGVSSFQNSTAGTINLYASETSFAGDSSACVAYNLVGDQGWGGSADLILRPANGGPHFQDMNDHEGLTFWYFNNQPADVPGNVSFVVKILEQGPEGMEEYQKSIGGIMADDSGEWKQVYVPFSDFTIPSWLPSYDGILQQDSIDQFVFQILAQEGTTTVGDICFDDFRSYDDQEVTELIDPPMPSSVINIENSELSIYPNPTVGMINVDGISLDDRLDVFDMSGKKMKSSYGHRVDVSELNSGFYILRIHTQDQIFSAKFLKH